MVDLGTSLLPPAKKKKNHSLYLGQLPWIDSSVIHKMYEKEKDILTLPPLPLE